ncbi:helix-turn-helix domain-containing protein [Paenibacillus sp. 1-18]|uniref:helix-turn-helix domain-containing protein n=1 Tax=Paenibacillus sp. 1-18 TaxID=1333846 RepID=UPI000472A167|nr:helix-turn-helix domain-containing protein [Paenibacillus sp. 1-18]
MSTIEQAINEIISVQIAAAERRILESLNAATDKTLNAIQASEYLGISEKTLYNMCKKKLIPHRKFGAKLMFSTLALDAWGREQDKVNYQPRGKEN